METATEVHFVNKFSIGLCDYDCVCRSEICLFVIPYNVMLFFSSCYYCCRLLPFNKFVVVVNFLENKNNWGFE